MTEKVLARLVIQRTTMPRAPYEHPKFPNVTIWEFAGIGTTPFQPQKYLEKMKFGEYDFFIIVSATHFKENDALLAKVVRKMNKNFYFVHAKVDGDFYSLEKSKPQTFNEEEILQGIKNDYMAQLQRANVFLVSDFDVSGYDFQKLEITLLKELLAQKHFIFGQCLPCVTKATMSRKRDSLKGKIWLEALKPGAWATIPFMGLVNDEVEMLEKILTLYQFYFGLDDTFFKTMAEDLHMSLEQLKESIKSFHLLSVRMRIP